MKEKWRDNLELTTFDGLTIEPGDFFITQDKYYAKYESILCQFKLLTLEECKDIFGKDFSVYKCTNTQDFIDGKSDEQKFIDIELDMYPVTFLYPNKKVTDYEINYQGRDKDQDEDYKMYKRFGYWVHYGFSYFDANLPANKKTVSLMKKQLELEREIERLDNLIKVYDKIIE